MSRIFSPKLLGYTELTLYVSVFSDSIMPSAKRLMGTVMSRDHIPTVNMALSVRLGFTLQHLLQPSTLTTVDSYLSYFHAV